MTRRQKGRAQRHIKELLGDHRRGRFVGRERELAIFESMLGDDGDRPRLLFVHGPAGIGKSTLLQRFADACEEQGREALQIDARDVDAAPAAVLGAIGDAFDRPVALLVDSSA